MSVTSFDIQSNFSERIVRPEKLSERKGFDAKLNLSAMQSWQKLTFKAGLHICPCCAGHKLLSMGYHDEAAQFLDASQRIRIDPLGLTDPLSDLGRVLKVAGLISDGKASKDLSTTFHVTHRESESAPRGRAAGYSHLPGQACRGDDEHDLVLFLIKKRMIAELKETYPCCDILVEEDRRTATKINRRPDLTFFVKSENVDLSVAVEVQKSRISFNSWAERNLDLSSNYSLAVWVFRASGAAGRFNKILCEAVVSGVNAWLYDIHGEFGQSDSSVVLIPAAKDYPDYGRFDVSAYGSAGRETYDSQCVRVERESEKAQKRKLLPVASRSSFIFTEDGMSILARPDAPKRTEVRLVPKSLPSSASMSPDEPFSQTSLPFGFASRQSYCHLWH